MLCLQCCVVLSNTSTDSKLFISFFCISKPVHNDCYSNSDNYLHICFRFLYVLPTDTCTRSKEILDQKPVEFQIDEYCNAGDVGQVIGGLLVQGIITEGQQLKLGPQDNGSFLVATVRSIHRNKVPCRVVKSGQCAAICLDRPFTTLRNGMVLLSLDAEASGCLYFQANVCLLASSSVLSESSEITAHINSIRQTVVVVGIFASKYVRRNETASVLFKFKQHLEYLRCGQRLLLRGGMSKGLGEVTKVFPLNS